MPPSNTFPVGRASSGRMICSAEAGERLAVACRVGARLCGDQQRLRSDIEEVLAHHTGQPVERLRADTDHDRVFTATAAREYGLIDQVITAR